MLRACNVITPLSSSCQLYHGCLDPLLNIQVLDEVEALEEQVATKDMVGLSEAAEVGRCSCTAEMLGA